MKTFLLAGIALVATGIAGAASAADMPAKTYAPPPAAFSWSGLYIGVSGGVARSQGARSETCDFFCASVDAVKDGATVGGQIGYNWQQGNALVGVEADFSWIDGDRNFGFCLFNCGFGMLYKTERQFIGTIRGRLGLTLNRTLVYVTGGLAYSDGKDTVQARDNPDTLFSAQSYKLNYGWVAGGGIEQAWGNNWTLRMEALYHSFGRKEFSYFDAAFDNDPVVLHATSSVITARVGVNYLFGGR